MCPKIPLKVLVKESGKLFLFFLVGTLLITSLQDFDLNNLLFRTVSLTVLFILIFTINTYLIYYFDQRRKRNTERIWKKTYSIGYCCTLIVFFLHHIIILFCQKAGIIEIPHNVDSLRGWKLVVFFIYATFVIYSFIFFIQNFVLEQYEKNRIRLELAELKATNSDAINQLLRQQIQPHFRFNALNVLKTLIKRDSRQAESYLLKLSDFLRVSISPNTSGAATLKEELKVCNDYMEMQKMRFGSALQYKVNIDPEDEIRNKKLPFFSLQPLLENAIKHNGLTEDNPLYIEIFAEGEYVIVKNNLQPKAHTEVSTGNGHNMLRKRYQILSGDGLVIRKDKDSYSVSLKILDL